MKRTLLISSVIVLAGLAARSWGQVVCSFESEDDLQIVRPNGPKAERAAEHATDGKSALKCLFPGSEKDTWPGLTFTPPDKDLSKYQVLAFDVYNPAREYVHLSWRIDDGSKKSLFGGQKLDPQKTTTAEIFIKGLGSELDTTNITKVYPYIRIPRKDVLLYFDNFRFMELDLRFTPLVYEETGPGVSPTDEDRKRGYMLFSRHWLDVVFPNSRPRFGETPPDLKAFAAPGEYEPITLSVSALADLKGASVSVSDLVSQKGKISADSITVYPVRCLDKRVTYSSKEYIKNMPVLLENRTKVDIAAGESKRFWIDVQVPEGALPGIYKGQAVFRADGCSEATAPILFRVLPFPLAEPSDMIWGDYYTGPKLAKTPDDQFAFLERDLKDMRRHGMTSVGLCMGAPVEKAEMTENGVNLNLDGASLYERFMDLYRDLGFPAPLVQLSDSGQSFAAKTKSEFGSDEYMRAYKGFWLAMQAECKKRGWPEIIVQPVDEPGWQEQASRDRNVALLKALKQIPGMRTEEDGPGDDYFHNEAGPYADVWNYNGAIAAPEVVAEAQKKGHIVMLYNCDVESYRPEIGRYVSGFFQKRAGTSGCYNWAYMCWCGTPYDDNDHPTGTWMHVYPPYENEPGGPSTGWQGFREGIDDYKYITTLERTIGRALKSGNAKAAAAAQSAKEKLGALLATIQYSPGVRSTARWTSMRPGAKGKIISGTLKAPTGWDFHEYDMARWQIADATLRIMEALGEIATAEARAGDVTATPDLPTGRPAELLTDLKWTTQPMEAMPEQTSACQITIPVLDGAPKLDGDITDPIWQEAAKIQEFVTNTGKGKPSQQTHAWLFVCEQGLYIAFECMEEDIGHLTAHITKDGDDVWRDDCVEIFVDGDRDRSNFKQIVVNALGKQFWTASNARGWRAKSEAAAKVGTESWTAEVKVPLADLQLANTGFGLNLCRERRPLESLELSCWSPTGGRFAQPDRFGAATVGTPFLGNIRLGRGVLGPNKLTATAANPLDREARFVVRLDWSQQGQEPRSAATPAFTLKPGESRPIELSYDIAGDGHPIGLRVVLTEEGNEKVLAQYETSQRVLPGVALSVNPLSYYLDRTNGRIDVGLALAQELRQSCALHVALNAALSAAPLRQATIADLNGDHLSEVLNVAGLPAGDYKLRVSLSRKNETGRAALSAAEARIVRLRGPFD